MLTEDCIVPLSLTYRNNSYILLKDALRTIDALKTNHNYSGGKPDYLCNADALAAKLSERFTTNIDSKEA